MRRMARGPLAAVALAITIVATASAHHATFNMNQVGHLLASSTVFHTDLAFWGRRAYQGTYNGYRIINIAAPGNPALVHNFDRCYPGGGGVPSPAGQPGDIVVWGGLSPSSDRAELLIRAHGSSATGATCDGLILPPGFRGLTFHDLRIESNPIAFAAVQLPSGTNTLTLVPDLANNRLIVVSSANGGENGVRMVEVPLDVLIQQAAWIDRIDPPQLIVHPLVSSARAAPLPSQLGRICHDTAVILGLVQRMACAGGNGYALWNLDPTDPVWGIDPVDGVTPASILHPVLIRSVNVSAMMAHSVSFTWDGEILVFGSSPGGGAQANCQSSTPDRHKSIRFFDVLSGDELGRHVLPRPQTNTENCTIHNFNVVPLAPIGGGPPRYILVHGSFQAGVGVVDFSDIRNPIGAVTDPSIVTGGAQHANLTSREIAFADPPPINQAAIVLGGTWSAYWFNGHVYDSDIRDGFLVWQLTGLANGAVNPWSWIGHRHLNPQTQEFSL